MSHYTTLFKQFMVSISVIILGFLFLFYFSFLYFGDVFTNKIIIPKVLIENEISAGNNSRLWDIVWPHFPYAWAIIMIRQDVQHILTSSLEGIVQP